MSDPARWTREEYDAHMAKFHPGRPVEACHSPAKPTSQPRAGSGHMNKIETLYAEILEARKAVGEVVEWDFEPGPLLLAPKQGTIPATRYWRDFRVVRKNGRVEAIEVKAGRKSKAGVPHPHFEDGARERLQMAAKKFIEYDWYLAWHYQGHWFFEAIK